MPALHPPNQRHQKQNETTPHVSRIKRILLNETGQMTIFVALIFQVLFVFFAMVINIGLLVHDKINLQNAVDLGAYYGAQRQAEILNEIAHINYQIHQDNKLLAWRYWVLGTLGRNRLETPPALTNPSTPFLPDDETTEIPSVCVANFHWREFMQNEDPGANYCYQPYGGAGQIEKIKVLPIIAPFVPGVVSAAIQIANLLNQQNSALSDSGPLSWAFAAQMMEAYRMALASRKAVIQHLRTNLVLNDFVDQQSQRVRSGVRQTIQKNLTVSNLSNFDDTAFEFTNGLANANCSGPNGDGSPTIAEIRTRPALVYTLQTSTSSTSIGSQEFLNTKPPGFAAYDPGGLLSYFSTDVASDSVGLQSSEGLMSSSLGFEKNPWCMAYVGVKAQTHPRKPFAPFGQSVVLQARAFAQPFGGRIGPWYMEQWPTSSNVSSGGKRVDLLSTPRFINNVNDGSGYGVDMLPNYSRYPGDQLGMRSKAAQASTRSLMGAYQGSGSKLLSFNYFVGFEKIPLTGDPLAWDSTSTNPIASVDELNVRQAETIAIAPDLFDATYYSIDLDYRNNYKRLDNSGARFGSLGSLYGTAITVAPDIGGRNGTPLEFDIHQEIMRANKNDGTGIDKTLRTSGVLGYFLALADHVLTGWAPNSATDFSFPSARFAACSHFADPHYMIPGACTNGGRVGYSVRIISRDHLLSEKWNIGGGGQAGPIRNKPDLAF